MRGFCIIMGFDGAGFLLHSLAGVPLPSHVLGLLLLTAALFLGIVKLEWVEASAAFLTKHMMLFFVPLLAGAAGFLPALGDSWLAAAVSLTLGTAVIMLTSGLATRWLLRKRKERTADEG
ncbi:CidA/LrgA family protein [Paenibacillus sacheonensis]|uniref:CidA/LrgA family protein n=1 Tax=Paenibacillus sacheonensis TaxID=742054 RepID=A0A7X4YP92_9BACL|nr:CidA/LrgA family protein [Paenibacillus sacheonensis]MBM7564557.1 holin-like protein [Paenibacillus sacheonensis]NBC69114.1 CidA/LrgA family protein [Paenibacillus sacheonensis]